MKKSKNIFLITSASIIAVAIIVIAILGFTNPESKTILHTSVPEKLDAAVTDLIFDENSGSYRSDSPCRTEGHELFGYEESAGKVTVYGYAHYSELGFMNGYLCYFIGGGGSGPFVAEFDVVNGEYTNGSMKHPEDGEGYTASIKKMFPGIFEVKAITYDNSEYIRSQQETYAKEYLESVGFDCDIALRPEDFDVKLLPAADSLPSGIDGHHVNYPFWLGTQMFNEDGKWIVYAQFYNEKEQKAYLTTYENGSTQAVAEVYALDDRNATYIGQETITVYPFFEDRNLDNIESLPKMPESTSAIIL